MTDPALQPSRSSYVDSYVPPQVGVANNQVIPPATSTSTSSSSDDALKKLEELVADYESNKDELKDIQLAEIEDLQKKTNNGVSTKVSHDMNGEENDPLAELEKALGEYEKKYQEKIKANEQDIAENPGQKTKVSAQAFDKAMDQMMAAQVAVDQPPTVQKTDSVATSDENSGEGIDEQNIFELLGVVDATEAEKESFLDELQQALWEDFLDKDLSSLVSEKEMAEITEIKNTANLSEDDKQSKIIEKIEQSVPDIEEIMMEKALELKEDMVWERVKGNQEQMGKTGGDMRKLEAVEEYFRQNRWKTGSKILNSLSY